METSFQSIGGLGQGTALANKSIRPSAHTQVVEKFGQSLSETQTSSILNTINVLGKSVSKFTKTGIVSGRKPSYKKAIVQLKEGEFIDFYSQI